MMHGEELPVETTETPDHQLDHQTWQLMLDQMYPVSKSQLPMSPLPIFPTSPHNFSCPKKKNYQLIFHKKLKQFKNMTIIKKNNYTQLGTIPQTLHHANSYHHPNKSPC